MMNKLNKTSKTGIVIEGANIVVYTPKEALSLIDTFKTNIIGGDIFSEDKNGIIDYCHILWGIEYFYLCWSTDEKKEDETNEEYRQRCKNIAIVSISKAIEKANKFNKKCYISFVLSDT